MTADEVEQIKARLEKITPGEWDFWDMDESGFHVFADKFGTRAKGQDCRLSIAAVRYGRSHVEARDNFYEGEANADFIAHAPADIAALLADNARLQSALSVSQAEKEVMREALEGVANCEWARRSGGPDIEDLLGLDNALRDAVQIAVNALQSTPPTAVARVIEAARDLIADVQARYPGAGTAEPFRCPIMQRMSEALAGLDGGSGR